MSIALHQFTPSTQRTHGQVAYTGLLQMFLTPRSVCVLVCNAEEFGKPSNAGGDQLDRDCRKLEELRVCDWMRSISQRVPENDVILVATKCDRAARNPPEIGRRMEEACKTWLAEWSRQGMRAVRLEHGVCLTSCCVTGEETACCGGFGKQRTKSSGNRFAAGEWTCDWRDSTDDNPPPRLLDRLMIKRDGGGPRGAEMVLPRSWNIALNFLEALERGR